MGSGIQLPALHLNAPPQQPSPLEQYGQLLQLKNEMQNGPLRQQLMQQQVQAGALENQQKEIQLRDQKAMDAASQEWAAQAHPAAGAASPDAMPDYSQLVTLARKHGASFSTLQGLQNHILDMNAKAATIAKDSAQTGNDNAGALVKKNGLIIDGINSVLQLPDEQLADGLTAAVQRESQTGLLAPEEAQQTLQLAQSGDAAAIRKALTIQSASLGGFSKLVEENQKKLQTQQQQGAAAFYAQNPAVGPQGVPTEAVQMADWLQKNPGKTPSDYNIAMKKVVPAFSFSLQQGAAQGAAGAPAYQAPGGGGTDWGKVAGKYGMTAPAFDQTAEKYAQTGTLPPIGRNANAIAMQRDLMNRAAELHAGESLAANAGAYKANVASLKQLQGASDQVNAFETTANANINMLKNLATKIPDLGVKFANTPVRLLSGNMLGTDNMAAFNTALAPVQTEAAKILNSANLQGQLSDSSRHELQNLVDGNLPYKSLVASLNVLQQDFKNRQTGFAQQIADINTRLKGGGHAQGASAPAASTVTRYKIVNGQLVPE